MKRGYKTGLIIILQVLFLFILIGVRYFSLSTGTPVLLKAAPEDPWDMFRGEYVRLAYDVNWIDSGDLHLGVPQNKDVYVLLEKDRKYWHAVDLYVDKPELKDDQVLIKGRINYFDEAKQQYRVLYGIESYYVAEGTGRALENVGAFEVLVRVDRFGSGVIEKIAAGEGQSP